MSISRSIWKNLATVSILGLGAALFQGETAQAASTPATLDVSANVVNTCLISTTPVNFGSYDGLSATPTDAAGTITVTCTNGMAWEVLIGQGSFPTGASTDAAPARQMGFGVNRLPYSLFSDAGRTAAWTNTAGGGVASNGTGSADVRSVYGRIAAGFNALPAGAYTDSVIATVNY
jgi:spore coat protein U-like protein